MPDIDAELARLQRAFCDEDTATWVAGSVALGLRARNDEAVQAWLHTWLAEDGGNIHRRRHALCAAASWGSDGLAALTPEARAAVDELVLKPLGNMCRAAVHDGGVVADLDVMPQWRRDHEKGRERTIADKRKILEAKRDNPKAAAGIKKLLDALEAETDESPLKPLNEGTPTDWMIPAYLAGVRGTAALGELPPALVMRAMCSRAGAEKPDRLLLVQNLPTLVEVLRQGDPTAKQEAAEAVEALSSCWNNGWIDRPAQLAEHLIRLAQLEGGPAPYERLLASAPIDAARREEWARALGCGADATSSDVATVLQGCVDRLPKDDWGWHQMGRGERLDLTVLATLLRNGGAKTLRLAHRIAFVRQALDRVSDCRSQVLPVVVRLLKLLLHEELQAAKPGDVAAVARGHLQVISPLVALWNLPGIVTKDLATIVTRSLLSAKAASPEALADVWCSTLFALPSRHLLGEAVEYCLDEPLEELLRVTESCLAVTQDPSANPAAVSAAYSGYAAAFASAAGAAMPSWVSQLPELVRTLARGGVTEERSEGVADVEATLLKVVRIQEVDRAQSEELQRTRRSRPVPLKGKEALESAQALDRHVAAATTAKVHRVVATLRAVRQSEDEAFASDGGRRLPDRWRDLLAQTSELERLLADSLPYVERSVLGRLLNARREELTKSFELVIELFEREDEPAAVKALKEDRHRQLVDGWMLRRHMLVELAEHDGPLALRALLSWPVVLVWILLPFGLTAWLGQSHPPWAGIPWAVTLVLNALVVLVLIASPYKGRLGRGQLFLPQVLGAMFLGVQQIASADESWSMAFNLTPWVRIATLGGFLAGAYFFTRELILGDQLKARDKETRTRKRRRTWSILALGMWQSFALVTLFAILGGAVMAGDGRAGLATANVNELAIQLNTYMPLEVGLGPWFFQPWDLPHDGPGFYRIFPWILATWTVQVYFFSAIIERVLGAGGSGDGS